MTQSPTLHDLIRMTGNGDSAAHDELYMRMRQPVVNHLLRHFGDRLRKEDAEDITHNTFIKIVHYASHYNGAHEDASARSWINKIAQSEALRMIKTREKYFNPFPDLHDPDNTTETGFAISERSMLFRDTNWEGDLSVEERVTMKTIFDKASLSMKQLSIQERQVLALRFEQEYTLEQIGRQIGRTKPRVKQILDGLIRKIRKSIGVDPLQE